MVAGAVLGLLLGLVLTWVWTPAEGIVVEPSPGGGHQFALLDNGRDVFSSTGWFVVLGGGAGLVAGVLLAVVVRSHELSVMLAGVAGSLVMEVALWLVAGWLGPEDPDALAADRAVETVLPVAFDVSGAAPWLSAPVGVLAGFVILSLVYRPGGRRDARV